MKSALLPIATALLMLSNSTQAQTTPTALPITLINARKTPYVYTDPNVVCIPYKPNPDNFSKKPEDRPQDAKVLIFDFDNLPPKTTAINLKTLTNKIIIFENCPLPISEFNQTAWPSKTMITPNNQIIHTTQPVGIEFGYANSNMIITYPPNTALNRRDLSGFANILIRDALTNPNFSPGKYIYYQSKPAYIMDTRPNTTAELIIPGKTIIPFKPFTVDTGISPAHLDSTSILIIDYNTHPGFSPLWKPGREPVHHGDKTIIYCNCPIPIDQFQGTGMLPPNYAQVIPPTTDEIEVFVPQGSTRPRLIRFYSVQAQSLPKPQQDAINNKVIAAIIRDKNL